MSTRRDIFKILAVTSVALPSYVTAQENKEVESQPGHLHTGPAVKLAEPSRPNSFQQAEFRTIDALTDTPGAKDAGVALL